MVTDRRVHLGVLMDILSFVPSTGFVAAGLDYSPIRGPEGNIEFLLHLLPADAVSHLSLPKLDESQVNDIISSAYDKI